LTTEQPDGEEKPAASGDEAPESGADHADAARKASVPPGREDEKINDDERERFNWESRYEHDAIVRIRWEAAYVLMILVASMLGLLFTWRGDIYGFLASGCASCRSVTFNRYAYLFFSGMLGGALFGLKYLYKVVARGWWNLDRGLWRVSSPWLSAGLAFATGALAHAGLFGFDVNHSRGGASFVSLGFIAGYFADSASRKMQEIADILFGQPQQPKKDTSHPLANEKAPDRRRRKPNEPEQPDSQLSTGPSPSTDET
jgi:hypothetical protein